MKLALLALIGAAAAIRAPTQIKALRFRGGAEDDDDSLFGGGKPPRRRRWAAWAT